MRNPAIRDKAAFIAVIQGFNDYFAEEYCAVDRDRLIGVAVLPNIGAEEDVAEMERCKRMGLKGALAQHFSERPKFSPRRRTIVFGPLRWTWKCRSSCTRRFRPKWDRARRDFSNIPKEPQGEGRPPTDFVQRFARQGPHHSGSVEASQLVVSGVFDRFPKLQIYWAENNVGWLPYFYEQIDHEYSINRFWAERQLGLPKLKRLPSEYLKEHAHWGFFEDHVGVKLRHEVGVDRMMWSTDFPHVVTRWPKVSPNFGVTNGRSSTGRALEDGGRQCDQIFPPRSQGR